MQDRSLTPQFRQQQLPVVTNERDSREINHRSSLLI
jgi:hypothetical protein